MMENPPKTKLNYESIDKLFNAKHVAVIGASSDPQKLSSSPLRAMNLNKYQGKISIVNPNHSQIQGHKWFSTIAELPNSIDAAVILLPATSAVVAAEQCVEKNILSIVVIAQGFGESGTTGAKLDSRLIELASQTGAVIVGPNTNGVNNARTGLALSLAPIMQYPEMVAVGPVSIISQSGAMVSSLLTSISDIGIGFCKTVTCGNELILDIADYLYYLIHDQETEIIVIYLEAIRDVARFSSALNYARESGKAVVAIKIGESDSASQAAFSHTGAIAGSYRNTVAFLRHHNVYIAEDIESLALIVACLSHEDWASYRGGIKICVASVSGGFAAHIADETARLGSELEAPSAECIKKLESLPTQSHGVNPYDIAAQHNLIPEIIKIFREDHFNVLVFGMVLMKKEIQDDVKQKLVEAKTAGMERIVVLSPRISATDKEFYSSYGIIATDSPRPVIQALIAIEARHSGIELSTKENAKNLVPLNVDLPEITGQVDEIISKKLLQQVGLSCPKRVELKIDTHPSGFKHLTYPLVMKGVSKNIPHKTEHGLVKYPIRNETEFLNSWTLVAENLRRTDSTADKILVEEFIESGIEVILGIQRDPIVGPVVVLGAGGILCELIDDPVLLIPPFSYEQVCEALSKTKLGTLLNGYRGHGYDLPALGKATINIGRLAMENPRIESLDINPLLVLGEGLGVIALDAALSLLPQKHAEVV